MGDSKNWRDIKEKSWAETFATVLLALAITFILYPMLFKWSLGLMGIYVPYKAMLGITVFLKLLYSLISNLIDNLVK